MNLTNGQDILKTSESNNYVVNASQLCRIIKTCAHYGVSHFKIGSIEFSLGTIPKDQLEIRPLDSAQTRASEQQAEIYSQQATHTEGVERLRDELEQLRLTDPLAYEKFIEGELGDAEGP